MKKLLVILILSIVTIAFHGCHNRDLTEGEEFKPREIHENIIFNFDKITVDGIEYLILEKDNNNPHEGFGFMAFRANKLMEKQDSVIALLKTIKDIQSLTYTHISGQSREKVQEEVDQLYKFYLNEEENELDALLHNKLRGVTTSAEDLNED